MCNGSGCDIPERYERLHVGIRKMNRELGEVTRLMDEVIEQRRKERAEFDKLGAFEQFKRAMGWS